jgi:hypothetical protein
MGYLITYGTTGTGNVVLANSPTLTTPEATIYPTTYIFSLLNNSDTTGPKTYTSSNGIGLAQLTADGGANIYTAAAFRDPRLLKVGSTYFLSYTALTSNSPGNSSIGLATSSDLKTWTTIATPNWSSFFTGSQASIWNGGWFLDPASGTYYLYFATADSGTVVTPYVVTFNPANNTFGTPVAVSLGTARSYADIMAVWLSGGTYYALLQSKGGGGGNYVELLTGTSPTGTWTIAGANNFAGWGTQIESGAAVTINGVTYVYFVDFGGGRLRYSTASGALTTGGSWSAPKTVSLGIYQNQSTQASIDWVDVVAFADSQTDQAVHALQGAGNKQFFVGLPNAYNLIQGITDTGTQTWLDMDAAGLWDVLRFLSSGTLEGYLGWSPTTGGLVLWNQVNAPLEFGTNNLARFWIGGSGGIYANGLSDLGVATVNLGGAGYVVAGVKTLTETANYSVVTGDSGKSFDNIGASGTVIFSLPAAAAGLRYTFTNYAGQTLEVLAAGGDQIAVGGSNSSSHNISSSVAYASITLEAHGTGQWITTATPDKTQWTVN